MERANRRSHLTQPNLAPPPKTSFARTQGWRTIQTLGWSPQKQIRRRLRLSTSAPDCLPKDDRGRKPFAFFFMLLVFTSCYLISMERDNAALNTSKAAFRVFNQDQPNGARGFGPSGLSSLGRKPKSVPGRLGLGTLKTNRPEPNRDHADRRARAKRWIRDDASICQAVLGGRNRSGGGR